MTTIIIVIALICATLLGFKYYTGRNKRNRDKSNLESIATTLSSKVEQKLEKVKEDLRDPETVRKELLHKLRTTEQKLEGDSRNHLTSLIGSKAKLENVVTLMKAQIEGLYATAKNLKADYLKDKDEDIKEHVCELLSEITILEKQVIDSEEDLKLITKQRNKAQRQYALSKSKIIRKQAEIERIVLSPNINMSIYMNDINDLTKEYENKVKSKEIEIEVNGIINNHATKEVVVNIAEVQSKFESL